MHKLTVITFGLLMSSLVMLSAMPLLNNNNNNAVVFAQGYNDYNYYSQYPTDDKKYECRTGPFEGFFVSSVEFCKHIKFDDRQDNRNARSTRSTRSNRSNGSTRSTRFAWTSGTTRNNKRQCI